MCLKYIGKILEKNVYLHISGDGDSSSVTTDIGVAFSIWPNITPQKSLRCWVMMGHWSNITLVPANLYPRLLGNGELLSLHTERSNDNDIDIDKRKIDVFTPDGYTKNTKVHLYKNAHLMLEFMKAPLNLVLHFPYYTLMTFLMLSMILLFMLMILLSILSVIRHLICGSNLNWLLNLNLI